MFMLRSCFVRYFYWNKTWQETRCCPFVLARRKTSATYLQQKNKISWNPYCASMSRVLWIRQITLVHLTLLAWGARYHKMMPSSRDGRPRKRIHLVSPCSRNCNKTNNKFPPRHNTTPDKVYFPLTGLTRSATSWYLGSSVVHFD